LKYAGQWANRQTRPVAIAKGRYDAAGTRWLRLDKSVLPRLTLRDGAGQAMAEDTVSPASGEGGTIAAAKEYVPGFGGVVGERAWSASGWAATYHQRDHLGSLRVVTEAAGAAVEAHDYYPFGGEMGPVRTSSRKKFTGLERDEETGLDYMLARNHSPALGRFLSVDPGLDVQPENPQSWNLYGYVRNNPVNATDPDGKKERRYRKLEEFSVLTVLPKTATPRLLLGGSPNHEAYNCHTYAWHPGIPDPLDRHNVYPLWDDNPMNNLGEYVELKQSDPNEVGDRAI